MSQAARTTTEHHSQSHYVTWKEKNEPKEVLLQKPRLAIRFGVIKVTNLRRRMVEGRIGEANATHVKADMQLMFLGQYTESGEFSPYAPSSALGIWSDRIQLNWYKDGWHRRLHAIEEESGQEVLQRLKHVLRTPTILLDYLRNPNLDMLPIGREAFLLLFYTIEGQSFFYTDYGMDFLGRYKVKIDIYSNELEPETHLYDLNIRSWKDFELKESMPETQTSSNIREAR